MGLDLIILSDHNRSRDLRKIRKEAQQHLCFIYQNEFLAEFFKEQTRVELYKVWSIDSWQFDLRGLKSFDEVIEKDKIICFDGPWALGIRIGLFTYAISFNLRWEKFLSTTKMQEEICHLMFTLNKRLGGNNLIFIPDNGTKTSAFSESIFKKCTVSEILIKMKLEIGNPESSFKEIYEKEIAISDYEGYIHLESR